MNSDILNPQNGRQKVFHNRIVIIDELRGFAVLCMIVYHLFYSLIFIFGVDLGLNVQKAMILLQPFGAGLFIAISGFSSSYSKNNIKRGILFISAGVIISMLTGLFFPSQIIRFGILHFLGISILIYEMIQKLDIRIDVRAAIIVAVLLFIVTFNLNRGWLYIPIYGQVLLPTWMYQSILLAPLGLPPSNFLSADYFPLLPWFALFIIGSQVGKIIKKHNRHECLYKSRAPILSMLSKHALLIYVAHQPVIISVLWILLRLLRLNTN